MSTVSTICKIQNELKIFSLFPFQVPTISSKKERAVLIIDWRTMSLFKYKEKLEFIQYIKP